MKETLPINSNSMWRQLEILSMMYISDNIRKKLPDDIELTRETKDGGYDGKIIVQITENDEISHTIMMEAKFRTTVKSLPLLDCSKSLIIAFNRAVQTLYVVTNVLFSNQASEEIACFENKINLRVHKVDGNKLKRYVQEKRLTPGNNFTKEFLEFISSFNPEESNIAIKISQDKRPQQISPKFPAPQRNQSEPYENGVFKKFLRMSKTQIAQNNIALVVQGAAGVGKTIFLQQLKRELRKAGRDIYAIDLQLCGSPRTIFIKVLEALWGSGLAQLFTSNDLDYIKKELNELAGCLSDGQLDQNVLGAVAQAISMDQSALSGHSDTYFYYLTEFIYKLIRPYCNQHTFILAFYNLNKGEIDTLNFLFCLLSKISPAITCIIELRTPFFLEKDEKNLLSAQKYYHKFKNLSPNTMIIDIAPLESKQDIVEFLNVFGLQLTNRQLMALSRHLGSTPLYLALGASFIKSQLVDRNIRAEELSDREFDQILNLFSGSGNNILMSVISYYKNEPALANCFAAVVLLDGKLPYDVLAYLCTGNCDSVADRLMETSLFTVEGTDLKVIHNLVYDCMKKLSSPIRQARIAETLIKGYQNGDVPLENSQTKMFELSFYAGHYKFVLDESKTLFGYLLKEHEYYSVIKYTSLAHQSLDRMPYMEQDDFARSEILVTKLFSYAQLHIFETPDVVNGLNALETILNLNKYDTRFVPTKLWYLWLKWYVNFYTGQIAESFQTISAAKSIVDNGRFEEQLCGQIYWAYGLSHKRLTTLEQGICDFKEGLGKYPGSILLKYAVDGHEAHQYLRSDPQKTNVMCRKLVSLIENTDCFYNEVLQARVDVAMSAFYSGDYESALGEAQRDYEIARANSISFQEGRSMTIIAACYLMNRDIENAFWTFKKARHCFDESGNHLFMWRPSFSIGQIYYRTGEIDKALEHYEKFLDHEIMNLEERLPNLTLRNCELACLVYIARIYRENGRHKEADALCKKYQNPCFGTYYKQSDDEFQAALTQMHYLHNDYLIVLG